MRHDFESLDSVQWAKLGLPQSSACTEYKCRNCGQAFKHFYHTMPNIYEAIEKANIDFENCLATNHSLKIEGA